MEKISGIYCIENIVNNKKYIGKSIDINQRWAIHKYELKNNTHYNKHLQSSWNKHGADKFIFYVLEECPEINLNSREIFYISKYNTSNMEYGYNLNHGGNTRKSVSEATKEIIREKIKYNMENNGFIPLKKITFNNILQLDMNGNIVNSWNCSPLEIQKRSNNEYSSVCIYRCLNHVAKTHKKFIWMYLSDYENIIDSIQNGKFITFDKKAYTKPSSYTLRNPIYQYDFNGMLINIWYSWEDLKNNGYTTKSIANVCCGCKKTYKNYVWARKELSYDEVMLHIVNNNKIKITPDKKTA